MSYRFLIVSRLGSACNLALELKKEGHYVLFCITDKKVQEEFEDLLDGIVEKVDDWERYKDDVDVIIFDDVYFGKIQDELRQKGYKVIGGSAFGDKLELDREFASEFVKKKGLLTPKSYEFFTFADAIDFIKENPKRYVMKPSGKKGDIKEYTFVGKKDDGSDLVEWLNHLSETESDFTFILQEFVKGIEIGICVYIDGKKVLKPIYLDWEHKNLMNGELGPKTGEQGTLYYATNNLKLYEQTIGKIEKELIESGYCGCFNINCIVNEKGAYFLEFTSRFGYPGINPEMDMLTMPTGEFLYKLVNGQLEKMPLKLHEFFVCVVVSVPPYPYESDKIFEKYSLGLPLIIYDESDKFIHLYEVKKIGKKYYIAGNSGYVAVVCGRGKTITEAQEDVYKRIKEKLYVPNMMYRTDIGDKVKNKLLRIEDLL